MGIITNALEKDLSQHLRQRGIVFWLDKEGHYTTYCDRLIERHAQGDFFAPVIAFRGSYLEMILALEPYGNGIDPEPLLIHLPNHNEEVVRKTPLLELYEPSYRYRKALNTLIREAATGFVIPNEIETFLKSEQLTLEKAESWLESLINQEKGSIADYLEQLTPEWILGGLLKSEPALTTKLANSENFDDLRDYFHRHIGINQEFLNFYLGDKLSRDRLSLNNLTNGFIGWLLCVEYVQDLHRSPQILELQPLINLAKPLLENCQALIDYLRQSHPSIYIEQAEYGESRLEEEFKNLRAEDLGKIDTFRIEKIRVLEGAIQALAQQEWIKVLEWTNIRTQKESFWLKSDQSRRTLWSLVEKAANFGASLSQNSRPMQTLSELEEALEYYTEKGYQIDQYHRHFEQECLRILAANLPYFSQLLEIRDQLRQQYRGWADQLAQDFARICASQGFLPDSNLQQRTLYDQVVHPLLQGDRKVAYFLIDAFRYEMAVELLDQMQTTGITVNLKGRYCELPSITAVGMNVLAPLQQSGRLTLAGNNGFSGFKTGEYTVRKPGDRVRAISDRSAKTKKAKGLSLLEICDWGTTRSPKNWAGVNLAIVHSKEIDDAGEANVGLASFETWINQIKSAWHHLQSIGFTEFVFTADHGFLLQDNFTQSHPYDTIRTPSRRHVLTEEYRADPETVSVSLNSLNYEGQTGYLLFRTDTAVFATGNPGATFVHGGNSLQERVIPVLTVSHRQINRNGVAKYLIETKEEPPVMGYNRIRVRVKPAPVALGGLTFVGSESLNLALRVSDRPEILVMIHDAPGAILSNQQVNLKVSQDWIEVFFTLQGSQDERVRIQVFHPDSRGDIESCILETYFPVSGRPQLEKNVISPVKKDTTWQDSFEDIGVRNVFIHLEKHGSITEEELNHFLGSSRQVRRFAIAFDEYLTKVPFEIRTETTSTGKRYVKQN
ncbi:MAG: BREX-6 system phosphatase PglZ [Snowella sp.]|nr:BREX-6 system phosphatase PglZ [Snowella sp.]